MYYDTYIMEQIARTKQMDRMAEARDAKRWTIARNAIRRIAKPQRVR